MAENLTSSLGSPTTIHKIVQNLGALVTSVHGFEPNSDRGNEIVIKAVMSPDLAVAGQLTFVTQPAYIGKALSSAASVICFPERARDAVSKHLQGQPDRPHFFSKEPELAMRQTLQTFFQSTPYINRDSDVLIHPTAVIHPSAKISANVRVGPYAVISKDVVIGEDAAIGAHSVLETKARIGARTVLHPFVYIGHTCEIGADCEINPHTVVGKEGFGYAHDAKGNHFRIPHTGRVVLEDRVHLGASVNVDRGTFGETRIGAGAILDNRIHISHNVSIGAGSVITAGFVVAGSTKIGRHFLTGGNTTVGGHLEICDGVQLGGLSVVRKSITKPGEYGGNPLMPMREYLRMMNALTKIPQLVKKFRASFQDDGDES